jgi:hypothetical protein
MMPGKNRTHRRGEGRHTMEWDLAGRSSFAREPPSGPSTVRDPEKSQNQIIADRGDDWV